MYAQGSGVPKDLGLARGYFEMAAAQKEPEASYFLGMMHLTGEGAERSTDQALHWFFQGAMSKRAFMNG
jgi:TPR repeat protein